MKPDMPSVPMTQTVIHFYWSAGSHRIRDNAGVTYEYEGTVCECQVEEKCLDLFTTMQKDLPPVANGPCSLHVAWEVIRGQVIRPVPLVGRISQE